MSRNSTNKCIHLETVADIQPSEVCKTKKGLPCTECDTNGPNLWICLYKTCFHIGCSEHINDHSTKHFQLNPLHSIHMNLSSQRTWCYLCENEVFLSSRRTSLISNESSDVSRYSERGYERFTGESPETSCDEDDGDHRHMNGLVGLQNIANTCYMNAALQALSNSPPLTHYFLDCGDLIEALSELSGIQRKQGLARSYHRLIKDMWCRNKRSNGFVIPRGILYGIRNVHPMFRGYQQHDTQEFLRCFMDQLHEELKEITPPPPDAFSKNIIPSNKLDEQPSSPSPSPSQSQSDAEYETCDSGVSEQSSLSDENASEDRTKFQRPSSPRINIRNIPANNIKNIQLNILSNKEKNNKTDTSHRSIISEIFDGKLLSSVQCLTCDRISTREETFQDLSLPIPGKDHLAVLHQTQGTAITMNNVASSLNCTDAVYLTNQDSWLLWVWNWLRTWIWGPAVSLYDCMAAFFSADELKGDNMYSCEKCNKLRNGIKYSRVLALPEMLCIHLKRFRHDLSYSSKIGSPVHFPLTGLDMRPYLHKDCKSKISTYDLTAVICHHGTVGGGHYTSYAKHELTGKWFEFDDQLVTEVNPDIVQNCQAYVLFYRKSNPQMSIIRSKATSLSELHPAQASDIQFFVSRKWINRFQTFAEPGPIDNWAILCSHGGIPPNKASIVTRLAIPLRQPVWDFLYKEFGGGPACNHLFECDTCRRAAELLARRQSFELETFTKLNDEFQHQETTVIYAISMAWFRQWQLFARGVTTEEPGPINNNLIAGNSDNVPIRTVKPGSDFAQINKSLWKFFYDCYGGGPEILLRGEITEEEKEKEKEEDQVEIYIENEQQAYDDAIKNVYQSLVQSQIFKEDKSLRNKNIKNVSFEDETVKHISQNEYENSYMDKTDEMGNNFESLNNKRSSGFSNGSNRIEILPKKEKKYRGTMKNTGLFGPEGKYNPQKQQTTSKSSPTHATNINSSNSFLNNVHTNNPNNNPALNPNSQIILLEPNYSSSQMTKLKKRISQENSLQHQKVHKAEKILNSTDFQNNTTLESEIGSIVTPNVNEGQSIVLKNTSAVHKRKFKRNKKNSSRFEEKKDSDSG